MQAAVAHEDAGLQEPSDGDNKTRIKEEPRAADALRVPTLKAATEACHNESTGSSAADASPWSAATTAAPGGGSTAATGGTSAAATRQKCPSRERGARSLRSAARAMQTRSCNSLDGTHSAQAPARAARAHSSGAPVAAVAQGAGSGGDSGAPGLAAPTLPPALTPMPSPAGSAPQYSLQVRAGRGSFASAHGGAVRAVLVTIGAQIVCFAPCTTNSLPCQYLGGQLCALHSVERAPCRQHGRRTAQATSANVI